MFALNEGSQWKASKYAHSLHGLVYLAMSNHAVRMRRRPLGECAWQLFDPQLYLATLDCGECNKVCARLASYQWFVPDGIPEFDSAERTQRDWEHEVQDSVAEHWTGQAPQDEDRNAAARAAVEFQADIGCTHVILPSPLITEREDEAETAAEWIDCGVTEAGRIDVGQPLIATVAVSEIALNDSSFAPGGFLDTIADQVSARPGIDGVYIVVAQIEANHPLKAPAAVTRAYAHLTAAFASRGYDFVFVNFADVFGVSCLGLGATGFATGPSQNLRRLSLAGFRENGGGPYPRFYSHPVIAEFLPDTDLRVLARRRLLRRVIDQTAFSRELFRSLNRTGRANNVAPWVESRSNVHNGSHPHFISRMIAEGESYARRSRNQRRSRAESWLEDAMIDQQLIFDRIKSDKVTPTFAGAEAWLAQYRLYA